MKYEPIRQLILRLPADSPYFQVVFRNEPEKLRKSSLAERLAVALNDPSVLWNLASSYAAAGLPLFCLQSGCPARQLLLLFPEHPDHSVADALALNLPPMRAPRDLFRAALCCRDATPDEIAKRFHLKLDLVRLFSELHWNFRDRTQEPLYVAQFLFKKTRFPDAADKQQEAADPGLRLMRLGYEKGLEALLQAAGPSPFAIESGIGDAAGRIRGSLLSRAAIGLDMDLTSAKDNPALVQALKLMLLESNQQGAGLDEDARRGLEGMSMGRSLTETFLEITRPDVERQLALQNEQFDEQRAGANQMGGDAVPAASTQIAPGKPVT